MMTTQVGHKKYKKPTWGYPSSTPMFEGNTTWKQAYRKAMDKLTELQVARGCHPSYGPAYFFIATDELTQTYTSPPLDASFLFWKQGTEFFSNCESVIYCVFCYSFNPKMDRRYSYEPNFEYWNLTKVYGTLPNQTRATNGITFRSHAGGVSQVLWGKRRFR